MLGANTVPAAAKHAGSAEVVPLLLEPETTELKLALSCSSRSCLFLQAASMYGKGLAVVLCCSVAKYKGSEMLELVMLRVRRVSS